MSRNNPRRAAGILFVVATAVMTIQCTGSLLPDVIRAHPIVFAGTPAPWPRTAAGGGVVTVDVTVRPGPQPRWNVPPAMPDTIAVFSNRGESGKREKRYAMKPQDTATYKLVLSNDGSPRTKWTLYEQKGGSLTVTTMTLNPDRVVLVSIMNVSLPSRTTLSRQRSQPDREFFSRPILSQQWSLRSPHWMPQFGFLARQGVVRSVISNCSRRSRPSSCPKALNRGLLL